MTSNVVGIVCALAAEARHLDPTTRHRQTARLADGTLLIVSGMGSAAAAAAARALIDSGATALASWGMAGGLDPALRAGAIFLPSEIVGLDGRSVPTTRPWRERLSATLAGQHPVAQGRLLTSATAVGSPQDKASLFRRTGAVAVDMESLAVAEVAQERGLPFLAIRVIVDSAEDALPRAVSAAADSAGHLHPWRLVGALARAPGDLGSLIRLARRYRAASRSLTAVARASVWAPYAFPVTTQTVTP